MSTVSNYDHIIAFISVYIGFPQLSPDINATACPELDNYQVSFVAGTEQYVLEGLEVSHMWSIKTEDNKISTNSLLNGTMKNETVSNGNCIYFPERQGLKLIFTPTLCLICRECMMFRV